MPFEYTDEPTGRSTAAVLREVNDAWGGSYRLVRPLAGGLQSGAWLVRDQAGTAAVLKWSPDRSWAGQIERASRAVMAVRRHGYPTPVWLAVGTTSSGYGYHVQEHVAGRSLEHVAVTTAHSLIDLLESHTGLDPDPGRSWSSYVTDRIEHERPAAMAAVAATGAEGRRLVDSCGQLLDRYELPTLPSADLVHGDFRPANILFEADRVSGVIDIEALGSGSRVFDYATLLDHEAVDDAAVELLVDAGAHVAGPAALAHCLVHVFLDLVLFMHRRVPTAGATRLDRRSHALSARLQLVSRLLGAPGG